MWWDVATFPRVFTWRSNTLHFINFCLPMGTTFGCFATFPVVVTWHANISHNTNLGLNVCTTFGCFGFCAYLAFSV